MKEYALFVKENGDIEVTCAGQFTLGASGLGLAKNFATLWDTLDLSGERLIELRNTGIDPMSGDNTFQLRTLPKGSGTHSRPEPEPDNCSEGRCEHPKNFAGSCVVYLLSHPPQRDC